MLAEKVMIYSCDSSDLVEMDRVKVEYHIKMIYNFSCILFRQVFNYIDLDLCFHQKHRQVMELVLKLILIHLTGSFMLSSWAFLLICGPKNT